MRAGSRSRRSSTRKMAEWGERTSFPIYVAWRINREGWLFILPTELRKTERHRVLTHREAKAINRVLESVL